MNSTLPFVSIVLPVRNEAKYILDGLASICGQSYPPSRWELIIADGRSTDGTRDIIQRYIQGKPDFQIAVLDNPNQYFSTGFNVGLAQAKGEIIIILGGHTVLDPDYVWNCVDQIHKNPKIECVGGLIDTVAENPSSKAIALAMSSWFGVGGVTFRTRVDTQQEVDTVAFAAYRRSAFDRCGPMDEEMIRNQDDEFNYRLRENGGRVLLVPTIHSRYYSRTTLRALWRQYYQYGYWKVRVMQKHPGQMRLRHFIPPLFVASEVFALLLALFTAWGWLALLSLACLYYLVNLLTSFRLSQRFGWVYFPKLVQLFTVLHNSYGFGFLVGLIRFWNRWNDRSIHAVQPYGTQVQVNDQI